jgi:hypothetical protein
MAKTCRDKKRKHLGWQKRVSGQFRFYGHKSAPTQKAANEILSTIGNILKPGVKTLLELFALADADIDEVLQGLPLAKRKLLKALIKQDR